MILAVDIGNTNIAFGLFKNNRMVRHFNLPTYPYGPSRIRRRLKNCPINDTVICSVVPKATRVIFWDLARFTGKKPYIIGKDIKVPLKNLYRKPNQVGQDRLVNAYAVSQIYGSPAVVVDFGTAVTFDLLSKRMEYLGGMILPGLTISLEALNQRTALLPKIRLAKPRDFIGTDTKNSMLSGIIYGFGYLTDNLILRIKEKLGKDAITVATGGDARLISKYCRNLKKVDATLTLKGLAMLYCLKGKKE